MNVLLLVCTAAVTVAAAVRSTWSPCGLSMLSTITPMAERSRGRRWGATVVWFVAGATLGGATLGLLAAAGAALVSLADLSSATVLGLAALGALVAAAMDLGLGTEMPHHRRQVDEAWLDQFRSWVYGAGFGFQIGTGLMTYIMTAGVYLVVVLGALGGRPAAALATGAAFGLLRGLAILLGAGLRDPDRLRVFHRRFELAGPTVRLGVVGVLLAVAVAAGAGAAGAAGAAVAAVAAAGVALAGRGRQASPLTPGVRPAPA